MDNDDRSTSFLAYLLAVLIYIIIGCALSIIYILLNRNSSYIYLCALTPVMFSFVLGSILKVESKIFRIENIRMLILLSLLCGIIISHFKWSYYDAGFYKQEAVNTASSESMTLNEVYMQYPELDKGMFDLFIKPKTVFDDAVEISKKGTWTLDLEKEKAENVTGVELWIVWGVEALMIVVLPSVLFYTSILREQSRGSGYLKEKTE